MQKFEVWEFSTSLAEAHKFVYDVLVYDTKVNIDERRLIEL